MQAYASAELTPLAAELRPAPFRTPVPPAPAAVCREATAQHGAAPSASAALASLVLDGLDDDGLAVLASRLLPHLSRRVQPERAPAHLAFTVASLAAELRISRKAIRSAIARGELPAIKRGSRWIISADAVQTWATAPHVGRGPTRSRSVVTPKAAGPSLRSVLCRGTTGGGGR